jgi:hypothetical protein
MEMSVSFAAAEDQLEIGYATNLTVSNVSNTLKMRHIRYS